MKCVICGVDGNGKEYKLNISGKVYRFYICDRCENNKGTDYNTFFDNIRNKIKPEETT